MGTFQLNYLYFLSARGFTIAIQVIDQYLLDSYCSPGNYKDNSPFEKNHHETLALLSSNIKLNKTLYNNSIGQSLDRVYGMLLRKGGLTDEDCKYCADISTRDATQCCPNGKEYIVWYTNCMLRYSNRSIFSVMELETTTYLPTTSYRVNTVFNELINKFTNNLVPIVASNGTGASSSIKFAKGDVNYTGLNFQEIVQCTPYLSGSDCNRCLSSALNGRRYPNMFLTLSRGVLKPSCYARLEQIGCGVFGHSRHFTNGECIEARACSGLTTGPEEAECIDAKEAVLWDLKLKETQNIIFVGDCRNVMESFTSF
ncbi:cysteine-rich receptor-like protein kinase 10 [Papaver somniferum]|uniref:cysteine-rich receptor-like protein kinase 10 n=1 Tax=Papaver somniferum TaxID=3469 RepID=UPI000E6F9F3A|nr:cysteine-rich receptor-like protein kinase 10 [Papaver somniferum]